MLRACYLHVPIIVNCFSIESYDMFWNCNLIHLETIAGAIYDMLLHMNMNLVLCSVSSITFFKIIYELYVKPSDSSNTMILNLSC